MIEISIFQIGFSVMSFLLLLHIIFSRKSIGLMYKDLILVISVALIVFSAATIFSIWGINKIMLLLNNLYLIILLIGLWNQVRLFYKKREFPINVKKKKGFYSFISLSHD